MGGSQNQRALAELSPMERRRNSPSFVQNSKKTSYVGESSPLDSSPLASSSPRLYWQNRDPASPSRFNRENKSWIDQRDTSPSPAKRSSIENLKRASRVKNSNMFDREHRHEYDPSSSPLIERPLATGRPLSVQVQGKVYGGKAVDGLCSENILENGKFPFYSPTRSPTKFNGVEVISNTPVKLRLSPGKSSISSKSKYTQVPMLDPENSNISEDEEGAEDHELPPGRSLHRHAKSVTFDAAPPQINEYEMTTPVPSSVASGSREGSYESGENEDEDSFDRNSSIEREESFDESLEDTDKTPIVLPEDWRFMSPAVANEDLAGSMENPFDGNESSPAPMARPSAVDARSSPTRTDSTSSNGERRPLPPLPSLGMPKNSRNRSDSANSISATAERINSSQRVVASPICPVSISKSEIHDMAGCSLSLEDRLRLMMQDDETPDASNALGKIEDSQESDLEKQRDEHQFNIHEDDFTGLGELKSPPRISRESILRKIKSRPQLVCSDEPNKFSTVSSPQSGRTLVNELDPDTPIPSLEEEPIVSHDEASVFIKQEDDGEGSDFDIYSIPDMYSQQLHAEPYLSAIEGHQTIAEPRRGSSQNDDDDESHYSDYQGNEQEVTLSKSPIENEGPPTPKALGPIEARDQIKSTQESTMSLPQFSSMLGEQDFGLGLESFLTPSPPLSEKSIELSHLPVPAQIEKHIDRPVTPEDQLEPPRWPEKWNDTDEEPRTPDSVIRHPVANSPLPESPGVPEPVATIKAPGGKLKTRPSLTPADIHTMAETRRQVSQEIPIVPPIPEKHRNRPSVIVEPSAVIPDSEAPSNSEAECTDKDPVKQIQRKSSLVPLEIPIGRSDGGLGFGLDQEFDRVIEAQKVAFNFFSPSPGPQPKSPGCAEYMAGQGFRPVPLKSANGPVRTQKGYLMRQNTRIVVASSASYDSAADTNATGARGTRSAGNSPRKPSEPHPWTTEPWNGKTRRKSLRQSGGSPQKNPALGPVPPLPGQQSNVTNGLGSVAEDEVPVNPEDFDDNGERGVLFVKVVCVKDLDLPLPKGERSYFALTLDNGLHCVTTAWLELGKAAAIGQEFELIVLDDLEFQLTLQTKLEEPKVKPIVESPIKEVKMPKQSTFSRVFGSPRKRKELELKHQEEAQKAERQRQQAAQASRLSVQPSAWDLLHCLVAKDGSFARSYVCLKDHESKIYGRPLTVDVPCFNEWATEDAQTTSSIKSKRSNARGAMQRRAPYKIGKLELQLLFVPKPKGSKSGDMPKSMNACIRELKEAEAATTKKWEGHLSQQGGDCPYWRRRFFTLDGSKFTAHHEVTRQPRATIHLAGASKLIDDRSALTRKETSSKGGGRRKSAFAEEEEGYMFVEEGFRIRFANGETIDFYADSAAEKDGWMKALAEVVGKDSVKAKAWTDLVLAKHRAIASKAAGAAHAQAKVPPARSAPQPPPIQKAPQNLAPGPSERDFHHGAAEGRRADAAKTRSMIF
ncbi:Bud site selection protein bud4 [Pseudocyphellaria aurata]|nr:Bud site selection protein bud4 [Pseudocyphellaria aurata]